MGFLVLLLIFLSGLPFFNVLDNKLKTHNPYAYLFVFGSSVSIPFIYFVTSYVTNNISTTLVLWSIIVLSCVMFFFKKTKSNISFKNLVTFAFLTLLFFIFIQRTFYYKNETFYIASNIYSDLNVHLSSIRSFSTGENFPFELPFFAGKNIRYHFYYDLYTGILEYNGIEITDAFNLIHSLTFTSLFFIFLDFGKNIFKKSHIGFIAFFLFILPPDFSYINLLHNVNYNLIDLKNINTYVLDSFLGNNTMGNFLFFNTYVNQRHLFFSLSLSLALLIPFWRILQDGTWSKSKLAVIGIVIGLMLFWDFAIFICTLFFICTLGLVNKKLKTVVYLVSYASLVFFPQFLTLQNGLKGQVKLLPGFLIYKNFSITKIILFWILNLGLAIITIMGGLFISPNNRKKIFYSLVPIFITPNLFQLSSEMFHNHKFFNFWFMYMTFFSAAFISFLFFKNKMYALLGLVLLFFSIFSGILNFIVIKNDVVTPIPDYKTYKLIKYANANILKDELIITNGEIYDPLAISGRKIYLGRANEAFWFGANSDERTILVNQVLTQPSNKTVQQLKKQKIRYIIIYKDKNVKNLKVYNQANLDKLFGKIYEDNFGLIYKTY